MEENRENRGQKERKAQKRYQRKRWIRFRHRVAWKLAGPLYFSHIRKKYGADVESIPDRDTRQYLILMNHQTVNDHLFVAMAFGRPVYFLANDNLLSKGLFSSFLRFAFAPIPIVKQTVDLRAIKTMLQVAKEGGTISMSPEGNRTYSGETGYINPAVTKLMKMLKLPVLFFRIEGGYGVHPRWSDTVRRGKIHAYTSRIMEPEEVKSLSNEELYEIVCKELYVDETDNGSYYHKKSAEYLERAMYVCPDCGLSVFESHGNRISCKTCGREIQYSPTKELQGVGSPFPFRTVKEWYHYQCDYMNRLNTEQYLGQSLYQDQISLLEVIPGKKRRVLCRGVRLFLYGDRMELWREKKKELAFRFAELHALTLIEANRLNIYYNSKVYQIAGGKRFNALKYLNTYYRSQNICTKNASGFLGL